MHSYRDSAIVLRHCHLAEADKIITLLTYEHGLVRMVARGIRRTRSKFGSRLEIFNAIDVMLHPPKRQDGLGIIVEVETVASLAGAISADYEKYRAGCAIIETAERLAGVEFAPTDRLASLTHNALIAIGQKSRAYSLIVSAYLLRAMAYSGWLPTLECCAICSQDNVCANFHIPSGGAVCRSCAPLGSYPVGVRIIAILRHIYRGQWDAVPTDDDQIHEKVLDILIRYIQWHLNRQIVSLTAFSGPLPIITSGVASAS